MAAVSWNTLILRRHVRTKIANGYIQTGISLHSKKNIGRGYNEKIRISRKIGILEIRT